MSTRPLSEQTAVDDFRFALLCVEDCDTIEQLDRLCLRIKNDIQNSNDQGFKWEQSMIDHLRSVCKEHARLLRLADSVGLTNRSSEVK